MSRRASETEYARLLCEWLVALGWDLYYEVEAGRGGPAVDVVAVRGRVCWAIEVKASCSWRLLSQCTSRERVYGAHLVSAACPLPKNRDTRETIAEVFAGAGVGLVALDLDSRPGSDGAPWSYSGHHPVVEVVRPRFNRHVLAALDLRTFLRPEHKTAAAPGSPSGGNWTRFKNTCRQLLEYAEANPGALMTDAARAIEHHYGSDARAAQTLRVQVERGIVPGVRVTKRRVGNRDRVVVYALSSG